MTYRVGVIGTGIMGKNAVHVWRRHPEVEVVAICSRTLENLRAVARELKVQNYYTDHRELLDKEQVDIVHINTPDSAHCEISLDALQAGKHVLVEKPMTVNLAEADEIVRAVKNTGLKYQVSFNHRWLSVYHKVYSDIQAGKLGQCLLGYAKKNNPIKVPTEWIPWAAETTPAWFLSSHDIDLVRWWVGSDGAEVYATGIKKVLVERGIDTYDAIQAQVRFKNGFFATFESCWIYANTSPYTPDSYMEIIGSKGHVFLDRKAEAIEMATQEAYSYPRTFLNYKVFDRWVGALPACMYSFIDAIKEDREPYVTANDGRAVTAILDAVHRSLASGKPEYVN
ncbi:MAG: gfo/Idh/MocA family oxidoreductase [Calditrichaeota bacterium]|nr:MAG: gfo/Idh/MocA family oxidoreductase [Calditrichota bacterium]